MPPASQPASQTYRQTIQPDTETSQPANQTYRQTSQTDIQTDQPTRQTDKLARQTDRQPVRHIDRPASRTYRHQLAGETKF